MSYLQLTSKCNMLCEHCCMNATNKGVDMSWETFVQALKMDDGYLSLGGGEPTIHPLFERMLMYAIGHCEHVWLATNGSQTDIALALAAMAQKGVIGCALSRDPWHAPIDPRVIDAFLPKPQGTTSSTRYSYEDYAYEKDSTDLREIRDVSQGKLARAGRAARQEFINAWETKVGCVCNDTFITPDGKVHQCGCRNSPIIGNVFDGWECLNDECGTCYKEIERARKKVPA